MTDTSKDREGWVTCTDLAPRPGVQLEQQLVIDLLPEDVVDVFGVRLPPGLALGRGFEIGKRHGWLNADLRAIFNGDTTFETDLIAGLALNPRTLAIVQLQAGAPEAGRSYLRLAPSLVRELRPGMQLELGLVAPLSGGGERGVKLGLWRRF